MKIMLVTMRPIEVPLFIEAEGVEEFLPTRLREDPKDTKRRTTWMDRVAAEKLVMNAHREGFRVVCVGREAARAFDFRDVGSSHRNTTPKEGTWHEVPTAGSLPPIPIAWVDENRLSEFFQ